MPSMRRASPSPPPRHHLRSHDNAPAKWMVLVASIWIQSFSANPYSLYSPALKSVLGLNQFLLNVLAVAKDVGEHVGILPGFLYSKLPQWTLLSIGALLAFSGYGCLWLVTSTSITRLPFYTTLIIICIGSNSATWFNTAVLVTSMRNFSRSRGTIAGFLKGFVGLSAAIYTQIFTAFLSKDPLRLLSLLAVGPACVSLFSMGFVRPIKSEETRDEDEDEEQFNFFFISILCVVLAIYLLTATLLEAWVVRSGFLPSVIAAVMLLSLCVPSFVPLRLCIERFCERQTRALVTVQAPLLQKSRSRFRGSRHKKAVALRSRLPDIDEEDEEAFFLALAEGAVGRKKGPRRGEDFNLKQALIKADFWLLFLAFFCGVGPGVVTFNNLAQIGEAYGSTDVTSFLALLSIFNFLGRLGGALASEQSARSHAVPRPVWMVIAQGFMIVGNILFALGSRNFLWAASAIVGLCFGVQFSVMIPTASELFGLKHFSVIYNVINMSIPLGSLCFSALLAGILYDLESEKSSNLQERVGIHEMRSIWSVLSQRTDSTCQGASCFKLTFIVLAGVCLVGMLLSAILSYRIIPVYRTLYSAQLPHSSLPPRNQSLSAPPSAVRLEEEQICPR